MSRGGIIIQNRADGRGMMLPEREGSGTFNKLPFVSTTCTKEVLGLNPASNKIIIKSKKLTQKIQTERKKQIEDKFPLENYRKLKTSEQFWKKNENPIYKDINVKLDIKKINNENQNKAIIKDNNSTTIDSKNKILNNDLNYPKKLKPILNKSKNDSAIKTIDDKKNDEIITISKPEIKEVKIVKETNDKQNDIISEKANDSNNKPISANEDKKNEEKEEKKEDEKDPKEIKDIKDIKDILLDEDLNLDDTENIDDVLNYLNGLDYDKYCKDMQIREALTLLKSKMDKEQEEKEKEEEKNKNKVVIEGVEQNEEQKEDEKDNENEENKNDEEKKDTLILPEINKKIPEQNTVEIVNEEELKKKEEIKKYKIAEQIAKTEQMKAVHSANSIKKLLQRQGFDNFENMAPLKISVIKESPLANLDEYEANKLPFLHSLPLV